MYDVLAVLSAAMIGERVRGSLHKWSYMDDVDGGAKQNKKESAYDKAITHFRFAETISCLFGD